MLRQPLRTILLILLIGLATFAFFLRTAEFLVVRNQIAELGALYRPIGVLRHEDYWGDVSTAVELLNENPAVDFIDKRVGVEGILTDMYSPDIAGMAPWVPHEERQRITEAVVSATIEEIWVHEETPTRDNDQAGLTFWFRLRINDVYAGFPEHVISGGGAWMTHFVPYGDDITFLRYLVVDGAVHLFRGSFYMTLYEGSTTASIPSRRNPSTFLLQPLYEDGPFIKTLYAPDLSQAFLGISDEETLESLFNQYFIEIGIQRARSAASTPSDGIHTLLDFISLEEFWMWTMDFENTVDYSDLIPPHIQEEIEIIERSTRTVYLQTTRDMTVLPTFQQGAPFRLNISNPVGQYLHMLSRGRLLTYYDYVNANPVAVIDSRFRWIRDVDVGDTIEVKIPLEQAIVGLTRHHREFIVRGEPGAEYYVLELEIVGVVFDFFAADPHVPGTTTSAFIYIPESVLPEGLTISSPPPGIIPGWNYENHVPSVWYNFVLADARTEQAFYLHYSPLLRDLGVDLVMFETRPGDFWAVADPMLLMVTFNAVVFWIVLLLVLALVVFLFLSQRRRDIAIQQAIGFTSKRVVLRLVAALIIFGIPSIVLGGYLGWHIAVETTTYTLEPIAQMIPGFVPDSGLTWIWFVLMGAVVLILATVMLVGGALYMTSFPILSQLQGVFSKPKKIRKKSSPITIREDEDVADLPMYFLLPKSNFEYSTKDSMKGNLRWVVRQVRRSPLKSALGLGITLFFILIMGWLYESITRADGNVDELLLTTTVTGEVLTQPFHVTNRGHVLTGMPRYLVMAIQGGSYFDNYIMASGHARSFIMPTQPGGFPTNWYNYIDYDRSLTVGQNIHTLDTLYAFNNYEMFLEENYLEGFSGLEIDFSYGYDWSDFVFGPGDYIPLIVPESLLAKRDIGLGDTVYLGFTTYNVHAMDYAYAKVIGMHNMFVTPPAAREAAFMPLDALEYIMNWVVMYNDFRFTVDPIYNHDLWEVIGFINRFAHFRIWDESLNHIIGIARQTLLLLELIYPIALGASVIIAGGLSMLLMLQNAKSAAILHVVGTSKKKTMLMLLAEQFVVCLGGAIPGLLALGLMGVTFDGALFMAIGLYLGCVALGAVTGAVMIINHPPLALLQVKE